MELRYLITIKSLMFMQIGFVLLLGTQVFLGEGEEMTEKENREDTKGLRLEMRHVDSLMDEENTLHSPGRLWKAAEKSIHRAEAFARRAKAAQSQASSPSSSSAPVYSSDSGEYLVNLALGTPPQSFNGVLDTGSDLVWRQASPCEECFPQEDPLFDPSKSSTYKEVSCVDALCAALPTPLCDGVSCEYYYSYGDGSSSSGVLSSDTLTIGGSSVNSFVFGAGFLNQGIIGDIGTDGIIGMGGGPLALMSQMSSSSSIENKFSYCLVTWTDSPSKTSPLFLGSRATLIEPAIQSTPFLSVSYLPTFYYLNLIGISFNGELLDIPPGTFDLQPDGSGGVIIDSGTTVTILVDDAYTPIEKSYSSIISLAPVDAPVAGLDLCYNHSGHEPVNIPPLTFHFDGADVELPPENIFFDYQGYLCLAFIRSPLQSSVNIYGNHQQQNFQFLYDKGSANQLSFKPINCESL